MTGEDIFKRLQILKRARLALDDHLYRKYQLEDWQGVMCAAADLRETDVEIRILEAISLPSLSSIVLTSSHINLMREVKTTLQMCTKLRHLIALVSSAEVSKHLPFPPFSPLYHTLLTPYFVFSHPL